MNPQITTPKVLFLLAAILFVGGVDSIVNEVFNLIEMNWSK